jgi:2-oxoglutarate/2-oxoacid ferredoxin oxidoreductase subunit alpha
MIHSLTLVLSGQAGQGLQTIETLITQAAKRDYHVFSTMEVMSRVRGGNNTVEIRLAAEPVYAYKHSIDLLFLLNDHSLYRLHDRITSETHVFGEPKFIDQAILTQKAATFHELNLTDLAASAGSVILGNTVLFGFISGLISLDSHSCTDLIREHFHTKSDAVKENNVKAFHIGYELGKSFEVKPSIEKSFSQKDFKVLTGNEAIGIGTLAGGVNFISSYPMSPGTALLEYLAEKGVAFNVLVEQAEDEIAAITMCIGAWYAGARAMVTTSGGGFALMEEAVSLSGITETPCVIHIAQRPGPGTGLPTRTEQADLNLAVYSGHGEFPRIVVAPGSLTDGVLLAQKAFYLADKYQVPVFILSDQYYLDSATTIEPLTLSDSYLESFVVPTEKDYLRYKLTPSGISPRGIPGHGEGLVKCDSDEHDERGSITEDFNVRVLMNEKRLSRDSLILEDYIEPELIGSKSYKKLIIGWGSTYGVIKEAVDSSNDSDLAFLHVKQVYPLSSKLAEYLRQSEKTLIFENNATGQLANLIKLHLDFNLEKRILKSNGMPFTIEEVDQAIKEVF